MGVAQGDKLAVVDGRAVDHTHPPQMFGTVVDAPMEQLSHQRIITCTGIYTSPRYNR
jgi:hypothetical protein